MPQNSIYDILAQLEKAAYEMESLSADDSPAKWGRNLELQAELFSELYLIRRERKYLEQSMVAFEVAATYYRDVGQVHVAAVQRRLLDVYVDMARFQQPTMYLYKARDAGLQAQEFYVRTHDETREVHFELLARHTQIMTALALLERYSPYGDEAIQIGKTIISETNQDSTLLNLHIEGHRLLGKAYIGLAKMQDFSEQRTYLLEATRTLGKLRRFTHQAVGAESMLRGLLLMGFTYMELTYIENNPDYIPPAIRAFQQAIEVNKHVGDALVVAIAHYTNSMLYENMVKPQQASEAAKQSATFYRIAGYDWIARFAAFRAWCFAQASWVRILLMPLLSLLDMPVNYHRRRVLPYVLK
jgi:hypothetical protein